MPAPRKYPDELRDRAVRLVREDGQHGAIARVADRLDINRTELVELHGPWRTRTEAELAVLEYINWFNTARLHGELDHVPPREFEEAHYRRHTPDLVGAEMRT